MAALLRSARLLKISPSPLLQLKGTYRHAATASAVFSRVACRRAAGPSGALSSLSPCGSASVYCTLRYYEKASQQEGGVTEDPSIGFRNHQADNFDWALSVLDSSVRRTGRITKTLLSKVFNDLCRKGYPSGNHALLLLRSCGSLLPEVAFEERTDFAHNIWEKLQGFGVTYDVSHYNALLKVYLQNEFKFSPTDFLAKMEAGNVQPNRVTYQRLIAAYCHAGDIEGASKILAFMKSKDLPVTETVFNSLMIGHSRAGDLESATNILSVMRGAGIEPGPDTYVTLLCVYAENGEVAKIKEEMATLQDIGVTLIDRELMQVVFSLAKAGYPQHVPEFLGLMRRDPGYIAEAMNLSLSLITLGMEDTAFAVLKSFPTLQTVPGNDTLNLGNFFLRHCVNKNTSVEKLSSFCKDLNNHNFHSTALQFTLRCALESKNLAMALGLMKTMKNEGFPLRPHYFWPMLVQHQINKNIEGTLEVLKAMNELGVVPDCDTYSSYVLSSFPSADRAWAALKDAGYDMNRSDFFLGFIRFVSVTGKLEELLSLMSNPSAPSVDLYNFRGSLIFGFRRSEDVESMVKITELLYKDSRFAQEDSKEDSVGYFLYSLIKEAKIPEVVMREYLIKLNKAGITISAKIYKGIKKILESNDMPALVPHVFGLLDSTNVPSVSVLDLEKKLEERILQKNPADKTFKYLIKALCNEQNLSRVVELKAQHEDMMSVDCYTCIIELCLQLNHLEEAMKLKNELVLKDSGVHADDRFYIDLVNMLTEHKKLDEAVDLLKEMKEKNVKVTDPSLLFQTLNKCSQMGDSTAVHCLQDAIFTLGLVKPSTHFCSPLIQTYLDRGDLAGAMDAALECHKLYKLLPRVHDILCAMIKTKDTDLIQKAMDRMSTECGMMQMMYNLFFAFLWTGHWEEARKIIETPGLRAQPGRLQWFAQKCISAKKVQTLETMLDLTAKLYDIDRDEMYYHVFCLCKETNNWQKAQAIWKKMQEEQVFPRDKTLHLLEDLFKRNNQEVPLNVPELWYKESEAKVEFSKVEKEPRTKKQIPEEFPSLVGGRSAEYEIKILRLCKKGKAKDAVNVLMTADSQNIIFPPGIFNKVLKDLLGKGHLEEAMAVKEIAVKQIPGFSLSYMAHSLLIVTLVSQEKLEDALDSLKTMVNTDQVPLPLAINRLLGAMRKRGDVNGIQHVENIVGSLCKSMRMSKAVFPNSIAMAHINNGDIDNAVEVLESVYIKNPELGCYAAFRDTVEMNNEKIIEKLIAMACRLSNNHGLHKAATDLFIQFLDKDNTEQAKNVLQHCPAIAKERHSLMRYLTQKTQSQGQVDKIKNLIQLCPDFTEQSTILSYLMKSFEVENDLSSAKALYEQMLADGIEVNELTLKRLAKLYKTAGETLPFDEPPESFSFYADKMRKSMPQYS